MSGAPRLPSPAFRQFRLLADLESYPEAVYIETANLFVPAKLPTQVYSNGVIDEIYWYYDEQGAADYMALLAATEAYRVHEENRQFLSRSWAWPANGISHQIWKYFGFEESQPEPINLVAFGVGSADKERDILGWLISRYGLPGRVQARPAVTFVPIDISFPLLEKSLRSLIGEEDWKLRILSGELDPRPILGDFRNVDVKDLGDATSTLIVALGVVWNLNVAEVLSSFKAVLEELEARGRKALLLMDVEFLGRRDFPKLKDDYDNPPARKFFSHPLEVLRAAARTQDGGNLPAKVFEAFVGGRRRQISYSDAFGSALEGGRVDVEVLWRSKLDEFIRTNDLDRDTAQRYLLGGPSTTKSATVCLLFRPAQPTTDGKAWPRPILLGYSTRFDINEFEDLLDASGLWPIGRFIDSDEAGKPLDTAQLGYYLIRLKRPGEKREARVAEFDSDLSAECKSRHIRPDPSNELGGHRFSAVLQKEPGPVKVFQRQVTVVIQRLQYSSAPKALSDGITPLCKTVDAAMQADNIRGRRGLILWIDGLPPDHPLPSGLPESTQGGVPIKLTWDGHSLKEALAGLGF